MEVIVMQTRFSRLLLAALAFVATACGGPQSSTPADRTDTAALSATENAINPLPRDQVQDGGTVTWPLDTMPGNFNYLHLDGTDLDTDYVMFALLQGPFKTDAAGTPGWNPNLLASEPVLATEPQEVVTYEINPDAVWYDGTPITWEDFYWEWRAMNGTNSAYQVAVTWGYEDIESVEMGADEREVVVTYGNRFADWQNIFDPLYPASTTRDPQVFNEGWLERPLTTAGPFKLDSIDLTTQTITLVRNERWWGEPAKLDRLVYRVIEPDAQIDALANGEIDLMDVGPDANKYLRAQRIEGVELRIGGGPFFTHVTVNGTSENLRDVRVRRAIAMGIDRDAIAQAQLGPLGFEPRTLGNHIFMANQAGYQDNSGAVGTYDPDAARALLDEAGWALDGDVRMMDGRPLEVSFIIPGGVAASQQIAELAQNMLGQIGVTASIQAVPVGDFFDQYVRPGQFDLTTFAWGSTPYPISTSKSLYVNPREGPDGQLDVQQNYSRVGSEEIDRLFDEASRELDRSRAIEIANRIDTLLWEEVHSLVLFQRPEIYACKQALANLGAAGFQHPVPYEDIGWAIAP